MVPFNLGIEPDSWMEQRIQLFFDYCYPSVKNQDQKDFQWIIFFDSITPKLFLDRIIAQDSAKIIQFKFTDHWDNMDSEIIQFLNESTTCEDLIISTRLDCDDALSSKFIGIIQEKAKNLDNQQPVVLNCANGLILNASTGIFYRKKIYSNAFISLIQRKYTMYESIFRHQHQTIGNQFELFELQEDDMWLQVVHGGNLINKTSGFPCIKSQKSYFNIKDQTINKPNFKNLIKAYFEYLGTRFFNLKVKALRVFKNRFLKK